MRQGLPVFIYKVLPGKFFNPHQGSAFEEPILRQKVSPSFAVNANLILTL